ncbi:MAG: hypothetical protein O2871_00490, partial [bacterium]|nr:hypothetical protein [bacterium]
FLLLSGNGPLGFLYEWFREISPVFREVFRFTYTKFSPVAILSYSFMFGLGISYLLSFKNKVTKKVVIFVFPVLLFLFVFPMFKGELFYGNLKLKIPESYFQVYKYFGEQNVNSRIVDLPQNTFWSWRYSTWGYRGSGFLWYGIEQPILDRAFDVWNHSNEQFYDEFQYAVYSENTTLLASTFHKYDVGFLILDKSIIAPGAPNATFIPQTKKLLAGMENVTLEKTYGDVEVYKINLPVKSNKWVVAPEKYINTQTKFTFSNVDSFSSLGVPYIKSFTSEVKDLNNNTPDMPAQAGVKEMVDFPFADDNKLAVAVSQNNLDIVSSSRYLNVPDLPADKPIPANLSISDNNLNIQYFYPSIVSGGKIVYAPKFSEAKEIGNQDKNLLINNKLFLHPKMATLLDKNSSAVIFDSKLSGFTDLSNDIYTALAVDCGGGVGEFGKRVNVSAKSVEVFLKNKNSCVVFMPDLSVKTASVVKVEFEYKATEGSRPLYCLSYNDTGECLNEKYENAPKAISNEFVQYVDYIYVENPVNYKFLAILESDDKQTEQSAEFRNIAITSYNVLQNVSLVPDSKSYVIGTTLQIDSDTKIILPDYGNLNQDYPAGHNAYNSSPKNCDNFNETSFDRKYSLGKYTYEAEDAVSCDSLDTVNINTSSSYLVDFVYKNIEGKGLDVCFASGVLQKCMLQDRLLTVKDRVYDTGNVKTESFIMPSYPSAEKIQINIGNQSIGRVKTVNELYQVQTRYIPYEWLKNIYASTTPGVVGKPLGLSNRLKVIEVKKTHTYKYEVITNGENGLLILNQSFDKGWIMFPKVHFPNFPDVRKDHVLVNNWANGWIINNGTNLIQDTRYTILFWPQYMQFAGYLVLGLWIIYLLLLTIRKRLTTNA